MERINRLADHVGNGLLAPGPTSAGELAPVIPGRPELVPFGFEGELLRSRWARNHLQWMRRKDMLDQDMYLLGSHGPLRRWLSLVFCHRMSREVEYVALTQDTTESDLKQRREIVEGGSALYFDQAPVRAAIEGRVLVRATRLFLAVDAVLPPRTSYSARVLAAPGGGRTRKGGAQRDAGTQQPSREPRDGP